MFLGKTSGGGIVPTPNENSSDFGTHGPENGLSDLPSNEGAGIVNPMFPNGLAGASVSASEAKGLGLRSAGIRRVTPTGGPGEGSVEFDRIPGSGVKIPKPGY